MSYQVLTHEGTGTQIVAGIIAGLGGKLTTVQTKDQAYRLPMQRLILLGGADISPFFYGEPMVDAQPPAQARDVIEWILIRRAMTERLPIFGICRGHQLTAVAHGGTLWQDIEYGLGLAHPGTHQLTQVKAPLAVQLPTLTVNSYHHQAVRVVPHGFTVAARAEDGIVEAIYRPGVLGVQWHPELLYAMDRRWQALFRWWYVDGLQ